MEFLVTGAAGQLGTALLQILGDRATGFGHELDIGDPGAMEAALLRAAPAWVLNAAAMTHVDRCEREPARARRENARAPEALAAMCARHGVRLLHVSTDYVFSGTGETPFAENATPAPRSVYGRTKLEGEARVQAALPDALIVRTSWVYGRGRNFVAAILAQAAAGRPLRVVDDQLGRPTRARDLAEGIVALVERDAAGLYHLANGGAAATWWDLARAALDEAGYGDTPVARIASDALQVDAPRPAYSVLDCGKAAREGVALRPWPEALRHHLRSDDAPGGVRTPGGPA